MYDRDITLGSDWNCLTTFKFPTIVYDNNDSICYKSLNNVYLGLTQTRTLPHINECAYTRTYNMHHVLIQIHAHARMRSFSLPADPLSFSLFISSSNFWISFSERCSVSIRLSLSKCQQHYCNKTDKWQNSIRMTCRTGLHFYVLVLHSFVDKYTIYAHSHDQSSTAAFNLIYHYL